MTTKYSILLVDDDPRILEVFPGYFDHTPDFVVAGKAHDGHQALAWLKTNMCDIVLSDVRMPGMDGFELFQRLRRLEAPPIFIPMTAFDNDATMLTLLSEGAKGYIVKSEPRTAVLHTLEAAISGGVGLSPASTSRLIEATRPAWNPSTPVQLSKSEQQLLALIVEGKTNADIATKLFYSPSGIKKKISSMCQKLGARNRVELAHIGRDYLPRATG